MALTEKLIEIVKHYPIIYDLDHEDYKNSRKKDKVWNHIGLELEENGIALKKKWKNLRDSYAKYLKSKITTGQKTQQTLYKWQWAKKMETFRPYMTSVKTVSNITENITFIKVEECNDGESSTASVQMSETSQSPSSKTLQDELTLENEDNVPCSETEEILSSPEIPISSHKNIRWSNPYKRTRTEETRSSTPTPTDTVLTYLKKKNDSKNRTVDDIDLIFSGYATTIKKFSPQLKINAKLKFAQLMAELELQHEQQVAIN